MVIPPKTSYRATWSHSLTAFPSITQRNRCCRWRPRKTAAARIKPRWQLYKLRLQYQKLSNFVAVSNARLAILTQSLDIQLLQFHCGALGSFVAIVSDRAVHSHVCVARIQEVVSQRLAARYAFGWRVRKHLGKKHQCRGAIGMGLAVSDTEIYCGARNESGVAIRQQSHRLFHRLLARRFA